MYIYIGHTSEVELYISGWLEKGELVVWLCDPLAGWSKKTKDIHRTGWLTWCVDKAETYD